MWPETGCWRQTHGRRASSPTAGGCPRQAGPQTPCQGRGPREEWLRTLTFPFPLGGAGHRWSRSPPPQMTSAHTLTSLRATETLSHRASGHARRHSQPIPLPHFCTSLGAYPGQTLSPHAPVCAVSQRQRRPSWGSSGGAPRGVAIATWTPRHTRRQPGTPASSQTSAQDGPRRSRAAGGTKGQSGR